MTEGTRRLAGRAALVTGASSGIGAAASRLLAGEGASVALLARGPGVGEVAACVAREGVTAVEMHADIADADPLQAAVDAAAERLGGLDVVVLAAAAGAFGTFEEIPARDFDRCVEVTFLGSVYSIRAALPHLERSAGRLIVVGSAVDAIPLTLMSPYVAAKAALGSLVESLRSELRASGSRVSISLVRPGPVDTPFWRHLTHADGLTPPPLPPLTGYSAESVARAAVACAIEPRKAVTVGGLTLALQAANRIARPLAERGFALVARLGRASADRDPAPGALWEASGDGRMTGGISGRPSLLTAARLRSGRPGRLPKQG